MSLPRKLAPAIASIALAASSAPAAPPDPGRLSTDVVPTFESLHLDLDAAKKTYSGSVTIELQVRAATDSFRLHARDMTLTRVVLRRGKATVATTTQRGDLGLLTIRTPKQLVPGPATLLIEFTNDFSARATSLYRVEAGGHSYAFTDFEPDEARGAWPCFDEPSFKIPWQVSVTIPKDHRAFSNTPPMRETVTGAKRRVVFRRTLPLSTYLIAVITGPLDTAPIRGLSVPGRVVTVKGNAKLAGPAVKETPPILAALERYFGTKYPYEKLDLIAVPEFSAGAMENAAAVTYRENYLLFDPKTLSPSQRKLLIGITAHELAHMWFGDLVTLAWWDELWLNESFASWLGDKVTAQVAPEFHVEIAEVTDAQSAMNTDSRLTTRAIRATMASSDNLSASFDVLSYSKGQAVLNMLERWLGAETFRAGVRGYITAHANGNATASDLWQALSQAAGRDASGVTKSFLEQPGVPLVTLEPMSGGRARLSQRRFLNFGLAEPGRGIWKIPVTLRYRVGEREVTQQVLLTEATQTVQLEGRAAPAWIHPNADERGYYRWSVPARMLTGLAAQAPQALSVRERVGFVGNLRALLDAGTVHGDQYLDVLARFAGDSDPQVVATVAKALSALRYPFVTTQTRNDFAAYVRRTMWPALERIGLERRAGEPEPVVLLRPQLLLLLGDDGQDPRAIEWGRKAAAAFLNDPASVDPSLQDAAISLAALRGAAALFETYRTHFERAQVPAERARFLNGLAAFTDETLVARGLRYAIEGSLRPQEILAIARGAGLHPELRDQVFEWTMANYEFLASHLPPSSVPFLPWQANGCSLERAARAREFFSKPPHNPVGTDKELEKVEAAIRDCASLQQREGAAVARYLARQGAALK